MQGKGRSKKQPYRMGASWKLIVLMAAAVAAVAGESSDATFWDLLRRSRRIAVPFAMNSGHDAPRGAYPFVASLLQDGQFICGGVILSNQHIITAKHCVARAARHYSVVLGEYDRTGKDHGEQTIPIQAINKHPEGGVDLAILFLGQHASFSARVSPITLASQEPSAGKTVNIMGWGWTRHGGGVPANVLRHIKIPIQDDAECVKDSLPWINHKTEMCAGRPSGEYLNVCSGDSGGPLVFRERQGGPWVLAGVVKGGHPKCRSKYRMALFVSVPNARPWIQQTLRHHMPVSAKGGLGRNGQGCFHGTSFVETPAGLKTMSSLGIGDSVKVITPEGEARYSKVIMFLDRQTETRGNFLNISTSRGNSLLVTPRHVVFRAPSRMSSGNTPANFRLAESATANKLKVGDTVFSVSDNGRDIAILNVTGIEQLSLRGMFAPLTAEGTVVVDNIVMSSYSHMQNHWLAHAGFAPIRWFYAASSALSSNLADCLLSLSHDGVHLYPKLLINSIGSLVMG